MRSWRTAANHSLITHNKPSNSWGYGNPVGNIKTGDAAVFSANAGTGFIADTVIGELFHLAGQNKYYTDEQLAKAVHNSRYASDTAAVICPGGEHLRQAALSSSRLAKGSSL